jgi:AcrR family transcriptional regulator
VSENPKPTTSGPERHPINDETVGAATRALADATAALTRLLGRQVTAATADVVGETIASSLREAAKGLANASEAVAGRAESLRGEDPRRAKVDRTRSELLAAAARVFAARGFEGASVGDIAADAGYTKGALYAHFGSKGELFLELCRERLDRTATADPTGADLADELEARLRDAGDETSALLTLEMLAYAVRHPESRHELGPLFASSLDVLARRVRDERQPRPDGGTAAADAEAAAHAPGPAPEDTDAAIGVFAVTNVTALLAGVGGREEMSRVGGRLIARLLGR